MKTGKNHPRRNNVVPSQPTPAPPDLPSSTVEILNRGIRQLTAMFPSVAQSGGFGPQVVAMMRSRGPLTRVAILQEVRCPETWLAVWLRPPYFALGSRWEWSITTVGEAAMHQMVLPPHKQLPEPEQGV